MQSLSTTFKLTALAVCCASMTLTGCGAVNSFISPKVTHIEYLRVFDIKTNATLQQVAKAAENGMAQNSQPETSYHVLNKKGVPDEPGRIELVNPFQGTRLAAFTDTAGNERIRLAQCPEAAWTAKSTRDVEDVHNLKYQVCLFPYKGGYHLDLFAQMTKLSGGLNEISRQAAYLMVGTPEQWTERTFMDTVRQIRKETGAEVTLIEAVPPVEGTPWLDTGEAIPQKTAQQ